MAPIPKQPKRAASPFHAGIDEAGRGCLAGPVVAAAVILPDSVNLPGLTDSKKLTPAKRSGLACLIKRCALAWSLGIVWQKQIDQINILQASLLAMAKSASSLKISPGALLIDGPFPIPSEMLRAEWAKGSVHPLPAQKAIIGGDLLVPSISAASILAKTFRDNLMDALDKRWPGYGFARNKGYGTKEHREALIAKGPTPLHRMTFRGVLPEVQRQPTLWPEYLDGR